VTYTQFYTKLKEALTITVLLRNRKVAANNTALNHLSLLSSAAYHEAFLFSEQTRLSLTFIQ